MRQENTVEVMIGGRTYTIRGYESEEYMEKLISRLNKKYSQLQPSCGLGRQSFDYQSILVQMNLADDYYQEKALAERLERKLEEKERELYQVKHELVAVRLKLDNLEKELENAQRQSKHKD